LRDTNCDLSILNVIPFIKSVLRGIGQIMLQENAFPGLLLLSGIFYGSIYMGLGTLLAAAVGTTTAYSLKFNRDETQKGLYGFSAALIGAAVFFFLKPVLASWLIAVLGAIGATLLQHFFIRRKIAAFTFPFVLFTWIIIYGTKNIAPDWLLPPLSLSVSGFEKYLFAFKGFGQVIFQGSLIPGVLFFVAVLIHSRVSALYGLVGAIISGFIAYGFAVPFEIENGLWSYNAVLCAIVFSGGHRKMYCGVYCR
jgi:urea transporter